MIRRLRLKETELTTRPETQIKLAMRFHFATSRVPKNSSEVKSLVEAWVQKTNPPFTNSPPLPINLHIKVCNYAGTKKNMERYPQKLLSTRDMQVEGP